MVIVNKLYFSLSVVMFIVLNVLLFIIEARQLDLTLGIINGFISYLATVGAYYSSLVMHFDSEIGGNQ